MRYYPVYLDLKQQDVVFSGAGQHAASKIRLLLKTEARIKVFGNSPCEQVRALAEEGRISLFERPIQPDDVIGARLVYGANDDPELDRRAVGIGRSAGALANIVDNLDESDFLTPAIVDRDPVTIAIGTEGTAPVLARKIKSEIEEMLPASTGALACIAQGFRQRAGKLKSPALRREFWQRFFDSEGPRALEASGPVGARRSLETLLDHVSEGSAQSGSITFVGAGPGDPDLLTMKARRKLHEAEVVLYDQLIAPEILELARREATLIHIGKSGPGSARKQSWINGLLIKHARQGEKVVRLLSGSMANSGRLDEEMEAVSAASIPWETVPGVTSFAAGEPAPVYLGHTASGIMDSPANFNTLKQHMGVA